ncbi:glycosyltransferase family 2 protein [Pedobacter psychroterrae]|uniref:Glycosyltransferase n=1 Tax=Pedobacter psychroterrae TaxID=2530453 RepID=A0A4R0NTH1_9SPHI|nr:glycosyltransferase family 2 protein [Pedobacter psychroterrae]TCD02745.1 glycosyltransferase [Pedobacter psychroterrae]
MKVSLITASYNSAATIEDTIKSVTSQTYKNIEYIIIDGASSDNTLDIANSCIEGEHVIFSAPDKGIYDAMNKGITAATGDVIGIINSDDMYQDMHVIKEVMSHFESDPELDIVYGDLVYVKADDVNKVVRKWHSAPYYPGFFEHANVPPHPTLFLRKKVYEKVGLFNLQYQLASDYEFMLRTFKKFNFKSLYIPRLMVKMRLGGATNKSLWNIFKGNKEILSAWRSNGLKVPFLLMPWRFMKRLIQFI